MDETADQNIRSRKTLGPRRLTIIRILIGVLCVDGLRASPPAWWSERHVGFANAEIGETATINGGYLDDVVKKAVAELNARLPGGAGEKLNRYIVEMSGTSANANRDAAVSLGKLEEIAEPFYDRLSEIGYWGPPLKSGQKYPWETYARQADDLAPAHIRDIKEIFGFDLNDDRNGNNLPDWWETWYGVTDPNGDADGDGVANLQEWRQGTDPDDFYNGQTPRLTIVSGDGQTAGPNRFAAQPIAISVQDASGRPLINAPVTFSGQGKFAIAKNKLRKKSLTLRTNTDGVVLVYYSMAAEEGLCYATAKAGATKTRFSATTNFDVPPVGPGNVIAEYANGNNTRIRWRDNSDDEFEFLVERSTNSEDWELIGRVPANGTSFIDVNVPKGVKCYYQVTSSYGGEY